MRKNQKTTITILRLNLANHLLLDLLAGVEYEKIQVLNQSGYNIFSVTSTLVNGLPKGWDIAMDAQGRPYYIDVSTFIRYYQHQHANKITTYQDPVFSPYIFLKLLSYTVYICYIPHHSTIE